MPKQKKKESIRWFIARELLGFGQDIVKAGFDLTVETPVKGLRDTLSSDKRRK